MLSFRLDDDLADIKLRYNVELRIVESKIGSKGHAQRLQATSSLRKVRSFRVDLEATHLPPSVLLGLSRKDWETTQ